MEKKNKKNDLLVERINEIFTVLYQGSEISKGWLSERFHITERTAYRDLARLANILDEVSPGKYRLSKERQSRLNTCELTQFSSFTDVAQLFPGSDSQLIRDYMADERIITINGHTSRDNIKLSGVLKQLRIAINNQNIITFQYKEKTRQAAPYKLINQSGLWYLAAEEDILKSFEVGRINSLILSDDTFPRNPYILDELKHNSGIYFGKKTNVTLNISPVAAPYFSRRDIFSEQTLLKSENDGSLLISASITESEHLFRWLRYWLPEIKIVTPKHLAEEFSTDLSTRVKTGMAYV